jgi:hypothetical protein
MKGDAEQVSSGSIPDIARLTGGSDCIERGFVQRAATSEALLKLGIQLHACGLSLSNTSRALGGSVSIVLLDDSQLGTKRRVAASNGNKSGSRCDR